MFTINHLELFSGIGGFRQAIDSLGNDLNIYMNCIGFSEIDKYALMTYKSVFKTESEIELGNIEEFTNSINNINQLPDFELLTGGFPCQPFSMMGKQNGFEDHRGNVFFNIINIIEQKKPKFVLLENVKNLKTHDQKRTLTRIVELLQEQGYSVFYDVFNTANFQLAQTRNRIFIFATKESIPNNFKFSDTIVQQRFNLLNKTSLIKQNTVLDILEKKVDGKYYLSSRIKKTILSDGTKNFKSKSEINLLTARPLTATMVKMHRACQDNYYSDNFINATKPLEYQSIKFSKEELEKHSIRKLTPREALLLQGFDEFYIHKAINSGVSNHQLYKQSGNAVSVNVVYAILYYIFSCFGILGE